MKKIKCHSFRAKDKAVLEYYLNEMAKQGWHIKTMNRYFLVFEKREEAAHYYVELTNEYSYYYPYRVNDPLNKQNIFYEDLGYQFVFAFLMFVIYRSEEAKDALHTDSEIEQLVINKSVKKQKFYEFYLPLLIVVLGGCGLLLSPSAMIGVFSNTIIFFLLLFIMGILPFTYFIHFSKAKKEEDYAKQLQRLHIKSFLRLLLITVFAIGAVLVMLPIYEMDSTLKYFVWYTVTIIVGGQLFWFIINHAKGIKRIIAIACVITAYFFCSYYAYSFLYEEDATQTKTSMFSESVMNTTHKEGEYRHRESLFIDYEMVNVFDENDNFFDYEIYQSDFSFLQDSAFRVMTEWRDVEYAYTYHGYRVYESVEIELGFPGEEVESIADFIIIEGKQHVMSIMSDTPFERARVERIIQQLPW